MSLQKVLVYIAVIIYEHDLGISVHIIAKVKRAL